MALLQIGNSGYLFYGSVVLTLLPNDYLLLYSTIVVVTLVFYDSDCHYSRFDTVVVIKR